MPRRARIDVELVRRGLARSRQQAAELIGAGKVRIDGLPARQAGHRRRRHRGADREPMTANAPGCREERTNSSVRWTPSRSPVRGGAVWTRVRRRVGSPSAAGAWGGGSGRGRRRVRPAGLAAAVDAGDRHRAYQRARPDREAIGGPVDLVVADLSFISLSTVLPALADCVARAGYRSHGEAAVRGGQGPGGAGGVVPDPVRADAGAERRPARRPAGWHTVDVTASPLPGPSGNVEYFLWLRTKTDQVLEGDERCSLQRADAEGPQ